ncbi:conserved hypothetical protein [Uncinocarpus reesii 1704]|uniref:AMP-dependent synthetase/ligase domain-containing protein n=1 Tax=Uncinocarpus reesii (strain UAMH 1704) TaxID=336963 RepID=C4JLY2_UNCRE|nr:uncharacterized protein UREG_03840 [Uncinocarpus reesii 1704]EEP78994.1 conserved hypothetical protein [Uncinocarpus reesii 1704]
MASSDSAIEKLDDFLSRFLADWDIYTTGLAALLVTYVGYVTFFSKDPDAHPYMLSRQAIEAPIRQPGESATFRALDAPHGYPLKSGLGVKDPETPKWSYGRNGDLRDIWRSAVKGSLNPDGTTKGKRGKIYTVLGKNVEERDIDEISKEINALGQYIRGLEAQNVAICLSDSVELLATLFAGAFYGFHTTIIPHNLPSEELAAYLQQAKADFLIAEAGAVDLQVLSKARTSLKNVVWVTKGGNKHLDWNQEPNEFDGRVKVAVWNDLVKEKGKFVGSELPPSDPKMPAPSVTTLWSSATGPGSFVEYTAGNLISAVAALGSSLPRKERIKDSDLFLSVDSLAHTYALCLTLAALYANASVALNSVAGEVVDLALATAGISPTIMVASSHTISDYHAQRMGPSMGPITNIGRFFQTRSLDSGVMPTRNWLWRLSSAAPTAELSLDKLRLLFISHRADGDKQNQLTSDQLTDLRIFTGARVLYALTAKSVAGPVCQTLPYDYRRHSGNSHFGPPANSVEIKLIGHKETGSDDRAAKGELYVTGPAVVSEKASLGVKAHIRDDNTLKLCD